MSNHSYNSKVQLNKISNYVLDEQSFDIKSYTSGHLNENHLWKPPEQKSHKSWETSISKLDLKKSLDSSIQSKINLEPDPEIGIKLLNPKNSKSEHQNFKLPSIISNNDNFQLPISNKELALNILTSIGLKGATKEEKYKNLQNSQAVFLKVDDLKINNILHSNNLAESLEAKLKEELNCLANNEFSESRMIVMRLNVYSSIFNELINESKNFGAILKKIKEEYDIYLFNLMKSPYQTDKLEFKNLNELNVLFDSTKTNRLNSKAKIQKLDIEIENTQNQINNFQKKNNHIQKKIFEEELFYQEKSSEETEVKPLDTTKKSNSQYLKKQTKAEKIEYNKEAVLKKLDELNACSNRLKTDYVPSVVILNLNQTIKDIEIETQKITEQNKFLRSQEQDAEKELLSFLINHDKTEFAEQNVSELIKLINNFNFFQKLPEVPKKEINKTKLDNFLMNGEKENKKFFDDYFS